MVMLEKDFIATDVLVIGSGIAGLRAGLGGKKYGGSGIIVTKGWGASCSIGAINAPFECSDKRDSPEVYYQDTLRGGMYLNNKKLVKILASQAVPSVKELENLGMEFDKINGHYAQRLVSGGTSPRAIHKEDRAGSEIVNILREEAEKQRIKILSPVVIIKIVKKDNRVTGAFGLNMRNGRFLVINAKAIVLAAGGIGHLYELSTYPEEIIGQGIALAYRTGAELVDMEFVQFEPTAVLYPDSCRGLLIPTAMFGNGGRLVNKNGERFMLNSKPGSETKAQKHELALTITSEVRESRGTEHGGVYFDGSMISAKIKENYPFRFQKLFSAGFDLRKDFVEVGPAPHSSMGGVKIDECCRTTVQGLFAAGEVAGGVHGANRIAGNGAAEAIVFGKIAGESAGRDAIENNLQRISENEIAFEQEYLQRMTDTTYSYKAVPQNIRSKGSKLQKVLANAGGVIRSGKILKRGIDKLEQIKEEEIKLLKATNLNGLIECLEIDSMAEVAEVILKAALMRRESRGTHYREDFPFTDDGHWLKNIVVKRRSDGRIGVQIHDIAKLTRSKGGLGILGDR